MKYWPYVYFIYVDKEKKESYYNEYDPDPDDCSVSNALGFIAIIFFSIILLL